MVNNRRGTYRESGLLGWIFTTPFVLVSLIFVVAPVVATLALSFFRKHPFFLEFQFIRWDNYLYVFQDPVFWASFRQAWIWTGASIVLQTVIGVSVALLLHQPLWGINIFRGLLLFPYMVPTAVAALTWRWMFNPEIGVVNYLLGLAGIPPVQWFASPGLAMITAIILNVWRFTPFVIIAVLARLQSLTPELYEAAIVDGANAWQAFWRIILPQLKEVLVVVVVFRTIWTFNKFEEIYLLTRGGPGTSTYNLAVYAYEQATANLRMEVAAAIGAIMLVVLLGGTILYLRALRWGEESV